MGILESLDQDDGTLDIRGYFLVALNPDQRIQSNVRWQQMP